MWEKKHVKSDSKFEEIKTRAFYFTHYHYMIFIKHVLRNKILKIICIHTITNISNNNYVVEMYVSMDCNSVHKYNSIKTGFF